MTTVNLQNKDVASVTADAVVLAVASTDDGPRLLADLPRALRWLPAALSSLGVSGAADEVVKVASAGGASADVLVLTGVGRVDGDRPAPEALRRAAGAAARSCAGLPVLALGLPAADLDDAVAAVEGALLGAYAYSTYKQRTSAAQKAPVGEVVLLTASPRDKELRAGVERARVVADAVAATRDLVNAPPVDLYPESFADIAVAAGKEHGLKVKVLDDVALAKGGYGGLTGVGKGSTRGPRLVSVTWSPRGAAAKVALVGKGITFDSGGLSIKPAASMETMKCDMGGAAAVLQTVVAAARLKLPVEVTGWLCLAENMPSGGAMRPSDVITTYGGRTVEVLNTDAEGRLVLADGIVAACEAQPDLLLDVATLTGAQMVALGSRVSAVMADDLQVGQRVVAAAERSGEQFWPMPLPEELRASMDSPVADIANMGERFGGMLVAGLFLREFVGRTGGEGSPRIPWAHLDIAGPAFNEGKPWGYTGKGGTGVAVRTLLQVLEDAGKR
ncbi:leucyl aminopeptidase [uncultured Pseudokineococcus sp.]|uniref:leucyl aminopeptidase n=1 Tax=uncultured Pseudokineococcus sp. TaxID=1642928 RepID=UPI0026204E38|nr:leucyl aminopeptidase [uncultured Pseudokineococcus sp.]